MVALAGQRYGDAPALRHKSGGRWVDVSYRRLAEAAKEVALGLADLEIGSGDRVAILSHTRPEWTYANLGILAAGAASVAIYQTNSAEECHYVLEHSESRAVFVEDAEQLAKVRQVEARLPHLERVIVMVPDGELGEATTLEELRERGRGRDHAEFEERASAVSPDDPALFIYTSGTTGPPKGCVLTHANYRSVCTMVEARGMIEPDDRAYLFLPLAHAFAVLIQFGAIDVGATLIYWERDPKKIVPNLSEVKPTAFPSVPRIFEKIYTVATSKVAEQGGLKERLFWWAVGVGRRVREREARGERPGAALRLQHRLADRLILSKAQAAFGGNLRQAITGAAPIATEILEFFWACGVPVLEGYGMTETATVAACNTLDDYRLGSVGRPLPGVEVRIADDGEIVLKGPNIFEGYYRNAEATAEALVDGWLHTGDLGHLDDDGFLYVTGRKKDIIITAGGKNITPANLENALTQSRWISQAVVLGDRRPYLVALVALDPEEAPAFAAEHGLAVDELPRSAELRAEIQRAIDAVNARVGPVEQIKRFHILDRDLSLDAGELTPTLKVKRGVVAERYAREVEQLYA
ncbi:MAG: long-chain fatty acid--CoA ligase, partial [Actinomycetota bacterium]|nr:long-chain fatty acid--CoA ligase [Actinomycetota bacterium]